MKQSNVEKAREEAAQRAATDEARLTERRVGLDAHEEDLTAREKALADRIRSKDEEIEKLLAQRTKELEQKHMEMLSALTVYHAGKLKEAIDAAGAAEAAKSLLEGKVNKLEADEDLNARN